MPAERRAEVTWRGELLSGHGTVTLLSSGAEVSRPLSWAARTAIPDGATSPEELLAAAHASCFAMTFAGMLARAGFLAQQLDVSAVVTFGHRKEHWAVTASKLEVYGAVPGIDETQFQRAAREAMAECPLTRALEGNVEMSVTAGLSSEELAAAAGP